MLDALSAGGALHRTAVVVAPPGATAGQRFATLCAACSVGERVRDEGGASLVVLDDARALHEVWETLVLALGGLGREL